MYRIVRLGDWMCLALLALFISGCAAQDQDPKSVVAHQLIERPDGGVSHATIHGDLSTARGVVSLVPSLGRGVEDFTPEFGSTLTDSLVARGYAVVLIQPRGIGNSTGSLDPKEITMATLSADLKSVFDALEIEQIALAGHAFGNRLSRYFTAQNPERVSGLVLLAAGGDFELSPEQLRCLFGSFDLAAPEATRRAAIACAFFARGNDPAVWMQGWYPALAQAQVAAARSVTSDEFKRAGRVPFLLVQPSEDFIAPPDLAGRPLAVELGDQVTYREVEGAGHALLPEQPSVLAEIVGEYLDGRMSEDAL